MPALLLPNRKHQLSVSAPICRLDELLHVLWTQGGQEEHSKEEHNNTHIGQHQHASFDHSQLAIIDPAKKVEARAAPAVLNMYRQYTPLMLSWRHSYRQREVEHGQEVAVL